MPRFAANLNLMFPDVPMVERFARARAAGFTHVEVLFPYRDGLDMVAEQLQRHELKLILIDADPGSGRGYLCHPGEWDTLERTFKEALAIADRHGCKLINALAGNALEGVSVEDHRRAAVEHLRRLAPLAQEAGVVILLEALSSGLNPYYFVTSSRLGLEIVRAVDSPWVKFQYDVFHLQTMEGNLIQTITDNLSVIGHVQIGDVPGRHEPGTGEVNFPNVFAALDRLGYAGYVGLEYNPAGNTEAGLDAWLPFEQRAIRTSRPGATVVT